MKNIDNYRKKFYFLLESEMGNVKPLISEQDDIEKPKEEPNVDSKEEEEDKPIEVDNKPKSWEPIFEKETEQRLKIQGCEVKQGSDIILQGSNKDLNDVEIENDIMYLNVNKGC